MYDQRWARNIRTPFSKTCRRVRSLNLSCARRGLTIAGLEDSVILDSKMGTPKSFGWSSLSVLRWPCWGCQTNAFLRIEWYVLVRMVFQGKYLTGIKRGNGKSPLTQWRCIAGKMLHKCPANHVSLPLWANHHNEIGSVVKMATCWASRNGSGRDRKGV